MDWIRVEDELPKVDSEFLAYAKELGSDKYQIIKATFCEKYGLNKEKIEYEFKECCNCSGYECDPMLIENVTHWMPLPENPK